MRFSFDLHFSFGNDEPERHDSDHTGYLEGAGSVVGFHQDHTTQEDQE